MRYEHFSAVATLIRQTADTITEPAQKNLATLHTRAKVDKSLVTDADGKAEIFLIEGLRQLIPSAKILGEETSEAWRLSPALNDPGTVWIIDPIDGTKPYSRGEAYGIMVGLRHKGIMQAVWIYCPHTKDMLFASQDEATHHVTWGADGIPEGRKVSIPAIEIKQQALLHYCPCYEDCLGIYVPVADLFRTPVLSQCLATEIRGIVLEGAASILSVDHYTPWDHILTCMIVERAGGGACFLGDAAGNRTGAVLAPSQAVVEKIVAAIRDISPGLNDIAEKMRATAVARGLTTEIYDDILARADVIGH